MSKKLKENTTVDDIMKVVSILNEKLNTIRRVSSITNANLSQIDAEYRLKLIKNLSSIGVVSIEDASEIIANDMEKKGYLNKPTMDLDEIYQFLLYYEEL